jgi:hypothetical protein
MTIFQSIRNVNVEHTSNKHRRMSRLHRMEHGNRQNWAKI